MEGLEVCCLELVLLAGGRLGVVVMMRMQLCTEKVAASDTTQRSQ